MPTDGHSGFLKTSGSHIGAGRLFWCWGRHRAEGGPRRCRQTVSGPHGSANSADCLPRGKPPVRPHAHTPALVRRLPEGGAGGNRGKRVSSGYNRRRRLATRSSGKQQAERTAVRAASIVCPEESPQCARRRKPLPRRGMTRRLRRELGLAVPWGAHTFLSVAKEKCAKESQRHGDSGKKPFIAHF